MIVCGIDPSISSTGICRFDVADDWSVRSVRFFGYCGIKKRCVSHETVNVEFLGPGYTSLPMPERQNIAYRIIMDAIKGSDICSIEGYAFGADKSNSIFQLGEFIGGIKKSMYDASIPYYIYPPNVVKMFATSLGGALKCHMRQALLTFHPEFAFPELLEMKENESPSADLIDAFWIGYTLIKHLQYQSNKESLDDETIARLEYSSNSKHESISETLPITHSGT